MKSLGTILLTVAVMLTGSLSAQNTFPSSGSVGVGTNSPQRLLHLKESGISTNANSSWTSSTLLAVQGTDAGVEMIADNEHGTWGSYLTWGTANSSGLVDKWGMVRRTTSKNSDFLITHGTGSSVHNNTVIMKLATNGNVGIGIGKNDAPDATLTVKGDIHTQKVKVDLDGIIAPDYVFADDYDLRTLEETASYIDEHHHLPEIPSAAEMEENGFELKEMNMKLLQKVEELTLYLIEQNKKIASLEQKVEALGGDD